MKLSNLKNKRITINSKSTWIKQLQINARLSLIEANITSEASASNKNLENNNEKYKIMKTISK